MNAASELGVAIRRAEDRELAGSGVRSFEGETIYETTITGLEIFCFCFCLCMG